MRTPPTAARRRDAGISLFEALIAMVIMAGGLVGLLAMQTSLVRSADLAKQRGEAVRLAQQQIESMRSFTKMVNTPGHLAWADLGAGNDAVSTNTTFTRSWALGGSAADPLREVSVTLAWQDRAGAAHSMTLQSVISKTDPADVGALGFPLPANTTLKRPKNRNLNIPVPAKDLGGGRSVYQLSSAFAVVFDNDSGYVVRKCDKVVQTEADLAEGCVVYDALILAGYISKTSGSFPSGLRINTAGLSGLDSSRAVECSVTDAVNQSNGSAIAGYKFYLCILPVTTGAKWSGTVRLAGMASGTDYAVCRFQYNAAAGSSPNSRNVQPYVSVGDSLDSQSYVLSTTGSCPTVDSLATTLHQNCTTANLDRSAQCPAT